MNIWEYHDNNPFKLQDNELKTWTGYSGYQHGMQALETLGGMNCIYCTSPMFLLDRRPDYENAWPRTTGTLLHVCNICGWWVITDHEGYHHGYEGNLWVRRSAAVLKKLDPSDISIARKELSLYLVAKFGDRFKIDPKRYEDVVAGVFADFGYRVRTTSYSGDKGIDIFILDGDGNDTVGVQVKRYKNKIEAEQIRSFAGALILNGVTEGVFVTTSSYSSGSTKTAAEYISRGLNISLYDSDRFYDRLKITRRPLYSRSDDQSAAFFDFWIGLKQIPTIHSVGW